MSDSLRSQHKEAVQRQFGETAEGYVESLRHRTGPDLVRLVELTEANATDAALDIATGGGHTALAVAPHVKHVVASDLTPRMLEAAEKFIRSKGVENVEFVEADAEDLPFDDASFDIVTCRVAPHHFGDPQSFVNEVARVLRPGGRFVLMDSLGPDDPELDDFINEMEARRDATHVRSYTLAKWLEFIENAGLMVDHHELVIRTHEYPEWTSRSKMSEGDREALDSWVLGQPQKMLDYFEIQITDGQINSFIDHKVLLRARKPTGSESAE